MKTLKNITILDRLLIFSSLLLFLVIFIVIISKKNVRGIESNVVYTIERIMSDNNALYENVRETLYSVTQYSPLYYMISDFNLSVLNISTENNSYLIRFFLRNEPTPTQGYGVSMGNNLMIDSRVGELISLRDSKLSLFYSINFYSN